MTMRTETDSIDPVDVSEDDYDILMRPEKLIVPQ